MLGFGQRFNGDTMKGIVFFPASAGMRNRRLAHPVTEDPVCVIDLKRQYVDKLGGSQTDFCLSLHPWDLKRIICRANQLGLKGKSVVGFGYNYDSEKILIGAKAAPKRGRTNRRRVARKRLAP